MEADDLKEYLMAVVNWDISKKLTLNDTIIGCYLLNEDKITDFLENCDSLKEDVSKYENLRGIQGVALALSKEFRDKGYGRKLREIPLQMDCDYIWGQHLKGCIT
jgi:hypothetical protein